MEFDQIQEYPPLREDQRLDARNQARENMIRRQGRKPTRDQFEDTVISDHPWYVVTIVSVIIVILLVAFFMISAQRLYTIGKQKFEAPQETANVIPFASGGVIAGVAIVIGSEAGALGFWLAAGVLAKRKIEQVILYVLSMASMSLALVGNIQFSLGGHWHNVVSDPFSLLEAVIPPVVVLGAGLVIERLWINDIERRHGNERAYQAALTKWQAAVANPEGHRDWLQVYATALWDAYVEAHKRKRLFDVYSFTVEEKRAIVARELMAENWFSGEIADAMQGRAGFGQEQGRTPRERVIEWLKENEGVGEISQAEIATFLDVSPATVSRAVKAYSRNGHSEE